MQARFTPAAIWNYLRSTYWFVPSILTLGAVSLALALIALDRHGWDRDALPGWFFSGGSDGARALLSAVAGSIITVVSVTFSVTIVALTVASQHFGPRLLNNFMRDTAAQVVLGIFIGTFTYCLFVLRVVQSDGDNYDSFVPHLAVTGAMALTLVSVAALIFYVHHVAVSMQVSEIARGVAVDLENAIDRIYPEHLGAGAPVTGDVSSPPASAVAVPFDSNGYVQHIEGDRILKVACSAGVVVWLQARPGQFATAGLPLAFVDPPPADPEGLARDLNRGLVLGSDRTAHQDAGFPVQQLVEVALHALSSGMNEPFTALTCIDRLGQGLARLAARQLPSPVRLDEGGKPRVITPCDGFVDLLEQALNPIRAHAAASPEVGTHMLKMLVRLSQVVCRHEDRAAIIRQARLVRKTMECWLEDEAYGGRVEALYRQIAPA